MGRSGIPITPGQRRQIVELHQDGMSRNAIAGRVGCSPATVAKVCAELGLSFDRTPVEQAIAASRMDWKERKAKLMENLLQDAERLRAQMFEPTTIHAFGGAEFGPASLDIEEPTLTDKKNIANAVQSLLVSVGKLETDTDRVDDARSLIDRITEAIQSEVTE